MPTPTAIAMDFAALAALAAVGELTVAVDNGVSEFDGVAIGDSGAVCASESDGCGLSLTVQVALRDGVGRGDAVAVTDRELETDTVRRRVLCNADCDGGGWQAHVNRERARLRQPFLSHTPMRSPLRSAIAWPVNSTPIEILT